MPKPVEEIFQELIERVTDPADESIINVLAFLMSHEDYGFIPSEIATETRMDIHKVVTSAVYLKDEHVIKQTEGYYYIRDVVKDHTEEYMTEAFPETMAAMEGPLSEIEPPEPRP